MEVKSTDTLNRAMRNSWITTVLFLGAYALVAGLGKTGGFDIWWHMKIGRSALETFSTLPRDIFSIYFTGKPWPYKDLISDIILYAGFGAFSFAWFAMLKTLTALCFPAALFLADGRKNAGPAALLVCGALAIAAIQYRIVERPLLFSLMLFPLMLAALRHARVLASSADANALTRSILPAVGLQWLWVCLHRGAMVGYFLFFVFLAEILCAFIFCRKGKNEFLFGPRPGTHGLIAAAAGFVASVVLGLLNPSTVHFFSSSFNVASSETLHKYISEWARLSPLEIMNNFPLVAIVSTLAFIAWIYRFIVSARRRNKNPSVTVFHAVCLGVFAWLGINEGVRWFPYLCFFSVFVIFLVINEFELALSESKPAKTVPLSGSLTAGVLMAVLVVSQNHDDFGPGKMENRYPEGAVEFARRHDLGKTVVNVLHMGGYLIWEMGPETKVLIDGRSDQIYPEDFMLMAIRARSDPSTFHEMRKTDGADWVMASNDPSSGSHHFLFSDPGWMLVYWSDSAVIYARRDAYAHLDSYRIRLINPLSVDASVVNALTKNPGNTEVRKQLEKELQRMIEASPESLRANAGMVLYYHFLGPGYRQKRDLKMKHLLSLYPHHPSVKELAHRLNLKGLDI